jgi:hypothetical protein
MLDSPTLTYQVTNSHSINVLCSKSTEKIVLMPPAEQYNFQELLITTCRKAKSEDMVGNM